MSVSADHATCPGPDSRGKSLASCPGGRNPERDGLSAGGRWIRTIGSASWRAHEVRPDSLPEEAGFEPSVPRETAKFSRAAHVASARFLANGKLGANDNRDHEDARCLQRDRRFESGFLQRRVRCETGSTWSATGRRRWNADGLESSPGG